MNTRTVPTRRPGAVPTRRPGRTGRTRRLGLAAAGVAALGAGTLLTTGPAGARWVPCEDLEGGTEFLVELCWVPDPVLTLPPHVDLQPDDDDTIASLPPGVDLDIPDDGPQLTLPPGGIDLLPGGDDSQPEQPPTEQPPDTVPPVDAPTGTTTPPADEATSQQPESPGQAGLLLPAVRITEVIVACDGRVRVAYETTADPALSADAEHLVSVSPAVVPDVAMTRRLVRQPLTGGFSAEIQAPADDYRVFVLVDFEPANPDGVLLADEAVAPAPTDCPGG